MDIEKLIRKGKSFSNKRESIEDELIQDLTDALSTLQAENENLRAELERVKRDLDAAVERLREWEKFDIYLLAHNFLIPEKWRGIQKED